MLLPSGVALGCPRALTAAVTHSDPRATWRGLAANAKRQSERPSLSNLVQLFQSADGLADGDDMMGRGKRLCKCCAKAA